MFNDDSADFLEPKAPTYEHVLHRDYRVPRTNEHPVALLLKYAGRGSAYWKVITKLPLLKDKQEATERAAKLFAQHAIAGWKYVEDGGKPVPYTPALGKEMLMRFVSRNRSDIVDEAFGAALTADNFCEPIVEADDLGKG
jgi:hypothetical protein